MGDPRGGRIIEKHGQENSGDIGKTHTGPYHHCHREAVAHRYQLFGYTSHSDGNLHCSQYGCYEYEGRDQEAEVLVEIGPVFAMDREIGKSATGTAPDEIESGKTQLAVLVALVYMSVLGIGEDSFAKNGPILPRDVFWYQVSLLGNFKVHRGLDQADVREKKPDDESVEVKVFADDLLVVFGVEEIGG